MTTRQIAPNLITSSSSLIEHAWRLRANIQYLLHTFSVVGQALIIFNASKRDCTVIDHLFVLIGNPKP
jgi:hypothetical protein